MQWHPCAYAIASLLTPPIVPWGCTCTCAACRCSGIYKVGGTDVYKGEKYLTLKFFMTVCLPDGTTMVGKANQTGLDPKYQEITVGTGVDLVASFILSSAIGLASGSGGAAAGALAGSGAA